MLEPAVEATNNTSERQLRGVAQERKTGRTSKTPAGAQRRSVMASLRDGGAIEAGALTTQFDLLLA